MTNDTEYDGWHNYETWAVKLWIDKDEPAYRYWREAASYHWTEWEEPHTNAELSEMTRRALASRLKAEHEEGAPELTGPYADLLSAALSEVDWFEIADNMLIEAELDGYEARASTPRMAEHERSRRSHRQLPRSRNHRNRVL